MTVGDPDNPPDVDYPRVGQHGAVSKSFEIGIRKVTNAEYAAFLNAVAKSDPHGLYHDAMRIHRAGYENDFRYSAFPASANAAVSYVSWVSGRQSSDRRRQPTPPCIDPIDRSATTAALR